MNTAIAEKPAPAQSPELKASDFSIPPCPAILTKLLRETRSDDPDPRRVSQLIGADVALAAAMLNVANSAYYGLRTKATSVQQAVGMLGMNAVSQRVTGLLLHQAFPSAGGMERYWKASMTTALIASLVSRETRKLSAEACHTYALFQNCGMPVMLKKFPVYEDIFNGTALAHGDLIVELEEERYAISHAKIGAQFAHSWQLSESLCLAIRYHHELPLSAELRAAAPAETLGLVAVGLAAEQIYCQATRSVCHEWAEGQSWALAELGLTAEEFAGMPARIKGGLTL
jgi:HD-like signal output (HDOD) protein